MGFFKHVGECNGKKVVITQRQLPGEDHMAGVIFSEIIPSRFHDDLMKVLESTEGQNANEFVDVLKRRFFSSGENMLEQLHSEGFIKKAPANNITVKPNSKSAVRLDELNKLLTQVRTGQIAQEQLTTTLTPPEFPEVQSTQSVPAAGTQSDMNSVMAEMMKTMQAMQKEIADLKKPAKKSSKTV